MTIRFRNRQHDLAVIILVRCYGKFRFRFGYWLAFTVGDAVIINICIRILFICQIVDITRIHITDRQCEVIICNISFAYHKHTVVRNIRSVVASHGGGMLYVIIICDIAVLFEVARQLFDIVFITVTVTIILGQRTVGIRPVVNSIVRLSDPEIVHADLCVICRCLWIQRMLVQVDIQVGTGIFSVGIVFPELIDRTVGIAFESVGNNDRVQVIAVGVWIDLIWLICDIYIQIIVVKGTFSLLERHTVDTHLADLILNDLTCGGVFRKVRDVVVIDKFTVFTFDQFNGDLVRQLIRIRCRWDLYRLETVSVLVVCHDLYRYILHFGTS